MNSNVDQSTIHVTVTALTSDGVPMPNETVNVRGSYLDLEIDGQSQSLTPCNIVPMKTGPDGKLTLVLTETSNKVSNGNLLNVSSIQFQASFMSRSSWFSVNPSETSQQMMKNATAEQVQGNDSLYPDQQPTPLSSATTSSSSASNASSGLNHLMGPVAPASTSPASSNTAGAGGNANSAPATFDPRTFHQADDQVNAIHTTAAPRATPLSPTRMPESEFVIAFSDGEATVHSGSTAVSSYISTLQTSNAKSAETLQTALGSYLPAAGPQVVLLNPDLSGGFFSDIKHGFDDIGDAFKHAFDDLAHIAVKAWDTVKDDVGEVVHQVEVVVGDVLKIVVKTVEDAVKFAIEFLKKIWTILKDLYEFLRALLDWETIVKIQQMMYGEITAIMNRAVAGIGGELITLLQAIKTGEKDLLSALNIEAGGSFQGTDSSNYLGTNANSLGSRAQSKAAQQASPTSKGSKSQYLTHKSKQQSSSFPPSKPKGTQTPKFASTIAAHYQDVGAGKLQSLHHLSLEDILKTLLKDIIEDIFDLLYGVATVAAEAVIAGMNEIISLLTEPIDIPFLSALYKLITGSELSLLSLGSLIVAVPIRVLLAVVEVDYDETSMNQFFEARDSTLKGLEPESMLTQQEDADATAAMVAQPAAGASDRSKADDFTLSDHVTALKIVDVCYLVSSVGLGIYQGAADFLEGVAYAEGEDDSDARRVMSIVASCFSVSYLAFQNTERLMIQDQLYKSGKYGTPKPTWVTYTTDIISNLFPFVGLGLAASSLGVKPGPEKLSDKVINWAHEYLHEDWDDVSWVDDLDAEPYEKMIPAYIIMGAGVCGLTVAVGGIVMDAIEKTDRWTIGEQFVNIAMQLPNIAAPINALPLVQVIKGPFEVVPLMPPVKAAIDFGFITIANVAIHDLAGYGYLIWKS